MCSRLRQTVAECACRRLPPGVGLLRVAFVKLPFPRRVPDEQIFPHPLTLPVPWMRREQIGGLDLVILCQSARRALRPPAPILAILSLVLSKIWFERRKSGDEFSRQALIERVKLLDAVVFEDTVYRRLTREPLGLPRFCPLQFGTKLLGFCQNVDFRVILLGR